MYKIVFLLPSRSRPQKFFNTIENIKNNCVTDNYEIICVCEETDNTMNNDTVRLKISSYPKITAHFTTTAGKINAINTGLNYLPEDYQILILIADDIVFTVNGFDSFIQEDMQKYYSDLFGCLHYPEPAVNDRQITMPVCGRKLIEHWGYLYHPSYQSLWCDNEMLSVLKIMKKVTYINNLFFRHEHPAWGLSETDALYKYNESFYQVDSENYFKRLANNFDL